MMSGDGDDATNKTRNCNYGRFTPPRSSDDGSSTKGGSDTKKPQPNTYTTCSPTAEGNKEQHPQLQLRPIHTTTVQSPRFMHQSRFTHQATTTKTGRHAHKIPSKSSCVQAFRALGFKGFQVLGHVGFRVLVFVGFRVVGCSSFRAFGFYGFRVLCL